MWNFLAIGLFATSLAVRSLACAEDRSKTVGGTPSGRPQIAPLRPQKWFACITVRIFNSLLLPGDFHNGGYGFGYLFVAG